MIHIAVGSLNPAKIQAVKSVMNHPAAVRGVDADSSVSAQPFSEEETKAGAIERARDALRLDESCDIGIGLEGGVVKTDMGTMLCNWGALTDRSGLIVVASGAKIPLPPFVTTRLESGEELGVIMADLTDDQHVRKKEGAVGIFTNGYVTRSQMFAHIAALLFGQYEYQKKA